jgi:hypothetical protein
MVASALGSVWRVFLIGLFTGVETVALVVWLALVEGVAVEGVPVVPRAAAIGLAVLIVGLFVEHFLTDLAVNGLDLSFPVGSAAFFSVTEGVLWAVWLGVADRVGGLDGLLAAGVVLAVLLVPQHTIEDNVLRGEGLFSRLLDFGTVGFSVVEAAGATVWLLLVRRGGLLEAPLAEAGLGTVDPAVVGVGVLAVALFLEHLIGVAFSRRGRA